jgi:hypothetical protein
LLVLTKVVEEVTSTAIHLAQVRHPNTPSPHNHKP